MYVCSVVNKVRIGRCYVYCIHSASFSLHYDVSVSVKCIHALLSSGRSK